MNDCFIWLIDRHSIKPVDKSQITTAKILRSWCFERFPFNLFTADIWPCSTCFIPKRFCFTSPAMQQLTHHFTDRQTHCFTDQLLPLTQGGDDTHWSANHLIDWNRNLFWVAVSKNTRIKQEIPKKSCGDGMSIISNGNRTEWSLIRSVIMQVINKVGPPRSGSPIYLLIAGLMLTVACRILKFLN